MCVRMYRQKARSGINFSPKEVIFDEKNDFMR